MKKNNIFVVPPYISHSIAPVSPYSAITLCINKSYILNSNFDKLKSNIYKIFEKNFDLKNFKIDFITDKLKQFKYNENFPENNLSINEMSLTEFTSKYHFIKKFKKTMGITPHKFLIQNRIRKAPKIISSGKSFSKTAVDMGFYDQSHFIKCFKKIVGLTPTDYKSACKKLL